MIPSDHFVRFYNEVFKFLDARSGLEDYYDAISRYKQSQYLEIFRAGGLRAVRDYYLKIRKEENCGLEILLNGHELILKMNKCPSLSKAMDNDAGGALKYCQHCPGWTMPLYRNAGLWQIFDLMEPDNPQCCEWIYDDLESAREKYRHLLKSRPAEMLKINFSV